MMLATHLRPVSLYTLSPYYDENNPVINTSVTIPNTAALGSIKMRIILQ